MAPITYSIVTAEDNTTCDYGGSISDHLINYCDLWKTNATVQDFENVRSFEDIKPVIESERDMESLLSMEDVVGMLSRRAIQEPMMVSTMLRNVAMYVHCLHDCTDAADSSWLLKAIGLMESMMVDVRKCGSVEDIDCSCGDRHSKEERAEFKSPGAPYDAVKYIPSVKDELTGELLERVYYTLGRNWQRVLRYIEDLKEGEIQRARRDYRGDEKKEFLSCMRFWKRKYSQAATWGALSVAISQVDPNVVADIVRKRQTV